MKKPTRRTEPGSNRDDQSLKNRASQLVQARRFREAEPLLRKLMARHPREEKLKYLLALTVWQGRERWEEPDALLRQALKENPRAVVASNLLSTLCLSRGRRDEAAQFARRSLELDPNAATAMVNLERAGALFEDDPLIERMRARARSPQVLAGDRRILSVSLGRLADRAGRYSQAFDHFAEGNRLTPGAFRIEEYEAAFTEIRELFTPAFFEKTARHGVSDRRMVFIFGMPRAGSTLLEQILCAHSQVATCGERPEISVVFRELAEAAGIGGFCRHLAVLNRNQSKMVARSYTDRALLCSPAPNASRQIDKAPGNFLYLGFIHMLFPNATLIHASRHPLDTCLSCFIQDFEAGQEFSKDLDDLAAYYSFYRRVMAFWREALGDRIVDIRYEDTVADTKGAAGRALQAMGLEWEDACLSHHQREALISTASTVQVRQPVHNRSLGRWRAYEEQIKPLIDALGDAAMA